MLNQAWEYLGECGKIRNAWIYMKKNGSQPSKQILLQQLLQQEELEQPYCSFGKGKDCSQDWWNLGWWYPYRYSGQTPPKPFQVSRLNQSIENIATKSPLVLNHCMVEIICHLYRQRAWVGQRSSCRSFFWDTRKFMLRHKKKNLNEEKRKLFYITEVYLSWVATSNTVGTQRTTTGGPTGERINLTLRWLHGEPGWLNEVQALGINGMFLIWTIPFIIHSGDTYDASNYFGLLVACSEKREYPSTTEADVANSESVAQYFDIPR